VHIRGNFHSEGSVLRGDAQGHCDGLALEVRLTAGPDVNEPLVRKALRLAHALCYAEAALRADILSCHHLLDGRPIEPEDRDE
jgi:hypothetical protein